MVFKFVAAKAETGKQKLLCDNGLLAKCCGKGYTEVLRLSVCPPVPLCKGCQLQGSLPLVLVDLLLAQVTCLHPLSLHGIDGSPL